MRQGRLLEEIGFKEKYSFSFHNHWHYRGKRFGTELKIFILSVLGLL